MVIIYVTAAIAAVGAFALAQVWLVLRGLNNNTNLTKYRDKKLSFNDLLIHASVMDDGVIVGKDGCFIAGWEYWGEDVLSMTDDQRNGVAVQTAKAFSDMGAGWLVHVDCVREPVPAYSRESESHFSSKLAEVIDQERREMFSEMGSLHEGKYIITLTWLPPKLAERKFVELFFDDENKGVKNQTTRLLESFNKACENFESSLSNSIKLKRLKAYEIEDEFNEMQTYDALLSHVQRCITGETQPVQLPDNPVFIDSLIGQKEFYTGITPKLGDKFMKVVAIGGFPSKGRPGILNVLSELPISYRWNTRFIFIDQHEAISHLEKFRKKWKWRVRGMLDRIMNNPEGTIDEFASEKADDAQKAISDVHSGLGSGYYSSNIILMDESAQKVEDQARWVKKQVDSLGFTARIESINTVSAFLGSLPGHGVENIRRPLMNALNLSELLPLNTIWQGESHAPCPMYQPGAPALMQCFTAGKSAFRLNLHVNDLGHTIIFGPPGTGKSTHLGMVALQFLRYRNAKVFCFDKGMSMYAATMAAGGTHFVIGEDTSLSFAPLSKLDTKERKAWAAEWIDTVVRLNDVNTMPKERNEIAKAIETLSQTVADDLDTSISEFSGIVQDAKVREALKQYTVDGLLGYLLDSEHDNLDLSNFVTFEIEKLMNMGDRLALPVLLYLFRRIEEALDGSPAMIVLDEAWLMLAHPVFKEKIREWLKTLRKKNCIVLMATQSLSDAKRSGILDVITESTATKIFLANPAALNNESAEIYADMGLNQRQIEVVANASPKRDYYYVSAKGTRLYQLALGDIAMAFVGKTDMDSIKELRNLIETHGGDWITPWLNYCGVKQ